MNNFIERHLADQYRPLLFPQDFSEQATFGFECNDGWADLIEASLRLIRQRTERRALDVKVTQVKEKLGQLRIYHRGGDESIGAAFDIAELVSGCVCELCGKPGEVINLEGWLLARCGKHRERQHSHQIEPHNADEDFLASYTQAVDLILSFFGAGAVLWVQQERTVFGGRRPYEMLATEEGCRAIFTLLKRLEHGVGV
ncbi:MbcA/ParS/Xre antitoxin family protein [Pseudomonas sp. P108]|uniref:MbcA/ParS/Xre antitoxin family protein n=1 Tax=Pseudomonas sp. P108 TaxID=1837993 RepID=UPI002934926F|nr:MbcA/ParS/Xre antitoxin family protein [Pseudomonas sp. P108]WNZ85163.1 MbcA/ParS/Xre antitoxin family protein [Pseudomonas sp. P108]